METARGERIGNRENSGAKEENSKVFNGKIVLKILLLGKSGMLGSCFFKKLSGDDSVELFAFGIDDLDIRDYEFLEKVFSQIDPDYVINCAAYTSVDACEKNKELAFEVNGKAVGKIAALCRKFDATLLHFSTDYVFDGTREEGYREDAMTSPLNTYGLSKLEGEKLVIQNASKFYIVRTSWLYGENGKNFVNSIIELGKENPEIDVVDDQIGSPTYTGDLVAASVENFIKPVLKHPYGIYHLSNSASVSWYDFAREIFKLMDMRVKINPISSGEAKRPAKRPRYSVLLNTKIKTLRPWGEALKVYLDLNFKK